MLYASKGGAASGGPRYELLEHGRCGAAGGSDSTAEVVEDGIRAWRGYMSG
jgi:hypothetical protein